MTAKALMLFGTGSDSGKSTLVAGLCRVFARRGLRVRPFKPQNMSNNAAATPDGGEIGRAQATQARACGVDPSVDMNPVLLKPTGETGAQIILRGKVWGQASAREYQSLKRQLLPEVLDSFARLRAEADLVLVEGAGSPAETNLRAHDIANLGFAQAAGVPGVLIGDIDRGGVIAAMVGVHAVLPSEDRAVIKAFLINKMRGDGRLFDAGVATIAERTGWAPLGVVPWCAAAGRLPAEDGLGLAAMTARRPGASVRIVVPVTPRIANFDDLDPLRFDPAVDLRLLQPGEVLPADVDLVLLPGSKATLADLAFFRAQGWDVDLRAHVRRGGRVMGICGGYQMLGRVIDDPLGLEGPAGSAPGLGLLAVDTVLAADKIVRPITGTILGAPAQGYEIHAGRSAGPDDVRAPARAADGTPDGAASPDGRALGCYWHGLFADDSARAALLGWAVGAAGPLGGATAFAAAAEAALDDLADHMAAYVDVDALLALAER